MTQAEAIVAPARDTNARREVPSYEVRRWLGVANGHCVVIPVINEGRRIQALLRNMADLGLPQLVDIIIADGGSSDGSLSDAALDEAGVRGLLVKTGPGKLSAQLRCAYSFVLDQAYRGIVTIDGNNKDDPVAIPRFIAALDRGVDFVQASRFIAGGVEENTPLARRLAITLIHAPMLALASGFRWTDTTQGFRAYSRRLLEDARVAPFRDVFSEYELLAYLSYRAPKLGYVCEELGTARRYPKDEKTPTKLKPLTGELKLFSTLVGACLGRFDP